MHPKSLTLHLITPEMEGEDEIREKEEEEGGEGEEDTKVQEEFPPLPLPTAATGYEEEKEEEEEAEEEGEESEEEEEEEDVTDGWGKVQEQMIGMKLSPSVDPSQVAEYSAPPMSSSVLRNTMGRSIYILLSSSINPRWEQQNIY